jgi:pimeloyl-ACP methyl ester carboxylesterase
MINILIHGLGQNNQSWNDVQKHLNNDGILVEIPNLYCLNNKSVTYSNLYNNFENILNNYQDKLNLCGLSLGGIIALEYAKRHPEKVNSLVLIGTPYKISKVLFTIQNIIFKFMPESTFKNIGISKQDFCRLFNSLQNINLVKNLENINCPTLLMCGTKDKANIKSLKQLKKKLKISK